LSTLRTLRLAAPEVLRDVAEPGSLAYVRVIGGELRIGSLTRHADLAGSAAGGQFAILRDVGQVLGDRAARGSATIGGVLCQADPADVMAAVLVALRASMVIRSRRGARTVPACDFRRGPHETAVESGELLTEIRIPTGPGGSAYEETDPLPGGCPAAGAAASIRLDGDTVVAAGLGLIPATALRLAAAEAEQFLVGSPAAQLTFQLAGEIAAGDCECSAGGRRLASDTKCMTARLTARALRRALLRAHGIGASEPSNRGRG
jgi:carbon-monoxide dehydrogenase medium subunit